MLRGSRRIMLLGSRCLLQILHYRRQLATTLVLVVFFAGCSKEDKPITGGSLIQEASKSPVKVISRSGESGLDFPEFEPSGGLYAGSNSCRQCHADVHATYSHHPMANSTAKIADDTAFDAHAIRSFESRSGRNYRVSKAADGTTMHHESLSDSNGTVIYDQAVSVQYAIGSGVHGKSYLRVAGDRLMQSPITWYSENSRWDLSPGYDGPSNPRFERLVANDCIHCHVGVANFVPTDRFAVKQPAFDELGISCERCHGPSQKHVQFHRNEDFDGSSEDPILKLQQLSRDAKDAVCLQCHMQGVRRIPHYGRQETSFRPGMLMSDVWTVFLKSSGEENLEVVSHGEQMQQSKCYQGSEELGCATCHDPHSRPQPQDLDMWYRGKCLTCHQESGQATCALSQELRLVQSASDSCVQCHMPKAAASRVAHTAHTDHRIPRFALKSTSTQTPASSSTLGTLSESGQRPDDANLQRAKGVFVAEKAFATDNKASALQAIQLLRPVLKALPNDLQTIEAFGKAAEAAGNIDVAISTWRKGLKSATDDELLLLLLATAYHSKNDAVQAEVYYRRLMNVNPQRSLYPGRLTHVLGIQGKLAEGIRTAEQALSLDPSLLQAHQWLAIAYGRSGDSKKSAHHQDMVNKLKAALQN